VTLALAVSAAKVRKAVQAVAATRPYASKAWQVLTHVAAQPGRQSLHPLLTVRPNPNSSLAIVITSDRGLAGAYNTNIIRFIAQRFDAARTPVKYIAVGRKGRDLLVRRQKQLIADFSNLPPAPSFADVSAIGRMAVTEFETGNADEVFLVYTDFVNMARQTATMKKLLGGGWAE
jgi:F-type H+-transporting ATPase subunit gamma